MLINHHIRLRGVLQARASFPQPEQLDQPAPGGSALPVWDRAHHRQAGVYR
jgi:hypothetical protein